MSRLWKLILLFQALLVVLWHETAPGLGQASPTLKTGVAETNFVAPLDPGLAPGAKFDPKKADKLLLKSSPEIESMRQQSAWYKIPSWLAGKWHRDKAVYTFKKNETTGNEDRSDRISNSPSNQSRGTYKDKTGTIWQYEKSCYWTKSIHDPFVHYHFTLVYTPTAISETECTFRSHFICFMVDKKTAMIAQVRQWERDATSSPVSATEIKTKTVLHKFDWHGKLTATEESVATLTKTSEFEPNWKRLGPDGSLLYPMFVQFLKDNGMADKVPDAPAVAELKTKP